MLAYLLAGWLCLPLAPLNPLEQDTLASMNLHVTAGVASPNGVVSAGPAASVKYEMLVVHPFVLRGGVDFRYGKTVSPLFPRGRLFSGTFSLEGFYYRGTDHLLGYIGLGAIYALHSFSSDPTTADSLRAFESVSSVGIRPRLGYRLTLGLRFKKSYSLEVAITELRPDFVKHGSYAGGVTSTHREETRTGGFRVTVGYLFQLSRR